MSLQGQGADRTMLAVVLTLVYATITTLGDNLIPHIAENVGLWQFHLGRSLFALAMMALAARVFGLRLWPRRPKPVILRALLQTTAIAIYFIALAFMPAAMAAAGLFTAPIFVLLLSRFAFGRRIGGLQIGAVVLGFLGVVLVLGPEALRSASAMALLPILSGFFYALANIATRRWCRGESAESIVATFFVTMGGCGLVGMLLLSTFAPYVPQGVEGFGLRGAVWPDRGFLLWTLLLAVIACIGIAMVTRAYQMADTGRIAV